MSRTITVDALLSDEALKRAAEKINEQNLLWGDAPKWPEVTGWHRAMVRAALDGALEVATQTAHGAAHDAHERACLEHERACLELKTELKTTHRPD